VLTGAGREEKAATKGREEHVDMSNAVDILTDIRRIIMVVLYGKNNIIDLSQIFALA
jgi:hypothetical protein